MLAVAIGGWNDTFKEVTAGALDGAKTAVTIALGLIGIMALWPFSRGYYESPWHVFMAISRRYWLPEFWTFNIRALGRELVILVPLAVMVLMIRRREPGTTAA